MVLQETYFITIDIAVVNAFVLHIFVGTPTQLNFRNTLVLQIIEKYGRDQRETVPRGRPPTSSCRVHHGYLVLCRDEGLLSTVL